MLNHIEFSIDFERTQIISRYIFVLSLQASTLLINWLLFCDPAETLMDTRTATAELGWTANPTSGVSENWKLGIFFWLNYYLGVGWRSACEKVYAWEWHGGDRAGPRYFGTRGWTVSVSCPSQGAWSPHLTKLLLYLNQKQQHHKIFFHPWE